MKNIDELVKETTERALRAANMRLRGTMQEKKGMHPSNYALKVEAGNSKEQLRAAVDLAFEEHDKARYWCVTGEWLYLFSQPESWARDDGVQKLPFEMDVAMATDFIYNWLNQTKAGHGPDDHDGSNEEDAFDLEACDFGVILRVRKAWSEYHK